MPLPLHGGAACLLLYDLQKVFAVNGGCAQAGEMRGFLLAINLRHLLGAAQTDQRR